MGKKRSRSHKIDLLKSEGAQYFIYAAASYPQHLNDEAYKKHG
jgi:hypothetical protein